MNLALAEKPSGCVVWISWSEEPETRRIRFDYRFFGGKAGKKLPSMDSFKVAKHTKRDAQGVQGERKAIRVVPKREFKEVEDIRALVKLLFGL